MPDKLDFEQDIVESLRILNNGGLILYPTDTIWGIGCDATNPDAVAKVYALKRREESKAMIALLADERDVLKYIASPDPSIFNFIDSRDNPTTIIFDGAIGFADNLVSLDGSIGIRLVQDEFCRHLIKRFRKPLVSTSANISGEPSPKTYQDITDPVRRGVDYIVKHRQNDLEPRKPSSIVRVKKDGSVEILR